MTWGEKLGPRRDDGNGPSAWLVREVGATLHGSASPGYGPATVVHG